MVKDLAIDMASMVGCWFASVLYGVNVVLFISCIYVLIYKRTKPSINRLLVSTSTIQFIICTAHVSAVLRGLIEGFVWSGRVGPAEIQGYWKDKIPVTLIVQNVLYFINVIIADSVMVWRLYALYSRSRWISAGPIILLITDAVTGCKTVYLISKLPSAGSVFVGSVTKWLIVTWSLSISVQIITTSLISWKIWRSSSQIQSLTGERHHWHMSVIEIIVESGLLYTLTTLTWLVLYVLKMQAQDVIYFPIVQISALVPALIIVRVGLNLQYSPCKSQCSSFNEPRRSQSQNQALIEISVRRDVDIERATAEYSLTELVSERKKELALDIIRLPNADG